MASRWSAPLYERPGSHGPRLLGCAWGGGGRDGSSPRERKAEHWLANIEADMSRGEYLDPDAGNVTSEKYAT